MKKTIALFVLILLSACAPKQLAALSAAEKSARVLSCKVDVVEPYFDSAEAARAFALDAMAGKVSAAEVFQMLGELGLTPPQIIDLINRFRACTPEAAPAYPPVGRVNA